MRLYLATALATTLCSKAFAKAPELEIRADSFYGIYEKQPTTGLGIRSKLVYGGWEISGDISLAYESTIKFHQAQLAVNSPKWKKFSANSYVLRSLFIPTDIGGGGMVNFDPLSWLTFSIGADYNLAGLDNFSTAYVNITIEKFSWKLFLNPTYSYELKAVEIIWGISYALHDLELSAKCWNFLTETEFTFNCQLGVSIPIYAKK